MDQSTRMLRTLGVLVISMTGTASLLGWVDPGTTVSDSVIAQPELIQMARGAATLDAAAGDVAVRGGYWDTVQLVAGPARAGRDGLLLSAMSSRPVHFTLDEFGRCVRSDSWSLQRDVASQARTIRVEIAQGDPHGPMSPAQWTAVRALLGALEAVTPDHQLGVAVDASWASAYGVEQGERISIDPIPVAYP